MKKIDNIGLQQSEIIATEHIDNGYFKNEAVSLSDLPSMCRVVIESKPGKGSLIISELWLPENWNGIFIGLGNGGMAGSIRHSELARYASQGYAVANTDMGTSRGRNSGINNPDVWMDFGWRATHIMTQVSKAIIKEYYGRKEDYSYFIGASTGGQQAYSEAQRFPEDYDGIIAGVPANNRVFLHTYFLWNYTHLRSVDGAVMFSENEVHKITECAAEFFNSKGDGEKGDNFVSFSFIDETTVDEFIGYLKLHCPEFTEKQLSALDAVYRGPVNPKTNKQIYNGMPIGSEIYSCGILDCQGEESPHFYPFLWVFGEDYNGYRFDFSDALEEVDKKLSPDLNANNPDLTPFYQRGGKMLAFSGSADPCVPYPDAIKYYNRVCDTMGGYETVKSFFKYFLLPGKDHGNSGRGVNEIWSNNDEHELLHALREWQEKGIEPEYILGVRVEYDTKKEEPTFVRKVYPYSADNQEEVNYPKSCDIKYLD